MGRSDGFPCVDEAGRLAPPRRPRAERQGRLIARWGERCALHESAASRALVAVALGVGACSAAAAQEGSTVCYAFQDLSTGFWVAGHGAIVKTLQDAGVEVVELNGGQNANRQLEQVQDCIAQGADGIILTADDGLPAAMVVAEAQEYDVPIATFNRPPSDMSKGIIVVADNEAVARAAVDAMVAEAQKKFDATGAKLKPLILMGDLADPNAVQRRAGLHELDRRPSRPLRAAGRDRDQVGLAGGAGRARVGDDRRSGHRLHLHLVRLPVPDHPVGAGAARQVEEGRRGGPRHPRRPRRRRRRLQADPGRLRRLDRRAGRLPRGPAGARRHPRGDQVRRHPAERGQAGPGLRALPGQLRRDGREDLGLPGPRRHSASGTPAAPGLRRHTAGPAR